jgi:ATP-binding cassette, subfamily B, bacterial MsbA
MTLRLLKYTAPYRDALILSLAGMITLVLINLTLPALVRLIPDSPPGISHSNWKGVAPALVTGLIILYTGISLVSTYALGWAGSKSATELRMMLFDRLLKLRSSQISPALAPILLTETTLVSDAAVRLAAIFIRDIPTALGLLVWLFYLDWKTAIPALTVVILTIPALQAFSRYAGISLSEKTENLFQPASKILHDTIDNHRSIRVYAGQQYETGRFREILDQIHRSVMKRLAARAGYLGLVRQSLIAVILAVLLHLTSRLNAVSPTDTSSHISLLIALLMLVAPLVRISDLYRLRQQWLLSGNRICSLLDQETEPDSGIILGDRVRGKLSFEDAGFYHARKAETLIVNMTLTIQPGEVVALLNLSEESKLTFTHLVLRSFSPTTGRILLDDYDLDTLQPASLHANIALVPKHMALIDGTVAANIAYGSMVLQATETRIIAAARAAGVMEFAREMPYGLQTLVGNEGISLDSWQIQRIAIARALLKNTPILILENPASPTDTGYGDPVRILLQNPAQRPTTIILTDEPTVASIADRVVVMQDSHDKSVDHAIPAERNTLPE